MPQQDPGMWMAHSLSQLEHASFLQPSLHRCQLCDAVQAEHQRQLTLVFSQHTAQVAELQRSTQLEEALKWRQHLAVLEGQIQASKERGDRLEEEVRAARKLVPWTPAAHEVQHSL